MKILLYDLEVSRAIVEGYWNKYDFSVVKTVRPQILMCYAYKWLGNKQIFFKTIHDYKTCTEFVDSLRTILDECDVAVGHNLKQFDDKMSNRFIIREGLLPPSPYIQIDTLQIARQNFKFQSNRLGELGEYLELGNKEKITYADLEDDFLNNPTWGVIKKMEKYNKRDVDLLEKVYLKLRP